MQFVIVQNLYMYIYNNLLNRTPTKKEPFLNYYFDIFDCLTIEILECIAVLRRGVEVFCPALARHRWQPFTVFAAFDTVYSIGMMVWDISDYSFSY